MKRRAKEIEEIADSLRSDAADSRTLEQAADIIRRGAGHELFRALIEQEKSAGDDGSEGNFIGTLMRRLEQVISQNAAVGAYLMGRLYGFAWQTADHAVYNGIELWMHNLVSSEAASALAQLSTEPMRPALKRVCSSWAKMIGEKVR
jgi:hypothetical protein